MNFVNNYLEPITLAAGAASADLSLPDGTYRLTITDSDTAPTRWEVVDAVVVGGSATLTRGQEGTDDQLWPAGSLVFCTATAGVMQQIMDVIEAGGPKGDKGDKGDPGDDGASVELQRTATHIQWRQVGAPSWTDLIALDELKPSVEDVIAAAVLQLQPQLLPAGGDEGQALTKVSAADYDVAWGVPPEMMLIVYAYDTWNNNQADMRAGYLDMETYGFTPVTWPDAGNSALPGDIGYSKSAGLLAVSPLYSSTAYILNAATLAVEQTSIDLAGYGALAMDPAGTTVVGAAYAGLGVAEIATLGTVDYDVSTRSGNQPGAFSPDGSRYYSPHNAGIDVFDTATWTLAAGESYTGSSCRLFTLSADGTRAACRHGSVIRMFNVSDWSTVADFALPDLNNWSDCVPLRFHPNSNDVLAVACRVDTGGGLMQCAVVYDATAPGTPLATIIPENDSGNDRADGGAQIRFNAAGTRMFLSCFVGLYVYDATDWTYITALGLGEYDQASMVTL